MAKLASSRPERHKSDEEDQGSQFGPAVKTQTQNATQKYQINFFEARLLVWPFFPSSSRSGAVFPAEILAVKLRKKAPEINQESLSKTSAANSR